MTFKLYSHQQEAVNFILNARNALLWHEVGLGKTNSALSAIRVILSRIRNHEDYRIKSRMPKALVIPPAYLVPQWRSEVFKFAPDLANQIVYLPYSQLHKARGLLAYYDVRAIVCDESHYLKTMNTARITNFKNMLMAIAESNGGFRGGKTIFLTGTPIPNSAAEMYTTWAMLSAPTLVDAVSRMSDRKRYMDWVALFTHRDLRRLPKNKRTKKKFAWGAPKGVTNEDKLHEVIKAFTHFRTAEQCLDLPEKLESFIDLGIQDDQLLADADINRPQAYMALVERLSRAKSPHAISWIKDFIENNPGERLIVFCPHVAPLEAIKEKFKEKVGLIIGGKITIGKRDELVKSYNAGETPILAGTYAAMSTGLNLQAGHNSLYIGYPWSPKIVRQAQGRTNRSGQTKRTRHYFLMTGDNDKKVLRDIRAKESGISLVEQQLYSNQDIQRMVDELM